MNLLRLTFRHIFVFALPVLLAAGGAALAQAPWPGEQPAAGSTAPDPAFGPAPGARGAPPSAFDRPAAPPPSAFDRPAAPQEPPCMKGFIPLREEAAKRAQAIHLASERKAPAQEACGLFNSFVAAEGKALKYIVSNASTCGVPPQAVAEMQKNHNQSLVIRTRVCQAAKAQQQGPAAPTLGDALGESRVPDARNVKTGRGTYDTLTGTPLGNK
jgi:hypothetical protein